MTNFGKKPTNKRFHPPKATRGGWRGLIATKKEAPLTGMVQNLKAAKGEERLSRTLNRSINKGLVTEYKFRMSPGQPKQTPGWLELDFLIVTPSRAIAVSVKGAGFVHLNTQAKDKLNEMMIVQRLKKMGYDVYKVESVFDYQLNTQEAADKVAAGLGVYR